MHIGAFEGKDSENNRLILEALALSGPSIKWGIYKVVKEKTTWPTVSRRVDDLKERGYIEVTGKKKIKVAKREGYTPAYWLTLKGLIAALTIEKVRREPSRVLQNLPGRVWAFVVKELKKGEINDVAQKINEEIRKIQLDLEPASELEILSISPTLLEALNQFPESYWRRLERNPDFLRYMYDIYLNWEELQRKIFETQRKRLKRIEARIQRLKNLMKKTAKELSSQ